MQLYLWLWLWVLSVVKLASTKHVELGVPVNMFSTYGELRRVMRAITRHDRHPNWLFRETTPPVFIVPDNSRYPEGSNAWNFSFEFCDDLDQLLAAYFREFRVEGIDDSWRPFSRSWSRYTLGQKLGLSLEFVGHYSYALVRLTRTRREGAMQHLGPLHFTANDILGQIEPGNEPSVRRVFDKLGTHFVHSFATGNALYQVLVYEPSMYRRAIRQLHSEQDVMKLLSPPYVYFPGPILTSSGNLTAADLASVYLTPPMHRDASLMTLFTNPQMIPLFEPLLGNEVIVRLDLKTLDRAIVDENKSRWFKEVVANALQLWEVNL